MHDGVGELGTVVGFEGAENVEVSFVIGAVAGGAECDHTVGMCASAEGAVGDVGGVAVDGGGAVDARLVGDL